jgi:hypothetical protein
MPDEMAGFDSLQVNVKSALKQSRALNASVKRLNFRRRKLMAQEASRRQRAQPSRAGTQTVAEDQWIPFLDEFTREMAVPWSAGSVWYRV